MQLQEDIGDRISASTALLEIARLRPLALETFYRWGFDPWSYPGDSLYAACSEAGSPVLQVEREILQLPVPPRGSDWKRLPCAFLIDFLTDEHRLFLQSDLPAIRHMLERSDLSGSLGANAHRLRRGFVEFSERIVTHITEEEARIFPGILESDYRFRYPGRQEHPARFPTPPEALLHQEEGFAFVLDRWSEDSEAATGPACPPEARSLRELIRELDRNVRAHSRLESECLYPMARAIREGLEAAPPADHR